MDQFSALGLPRGTNKQNQQHYSMGLHMNTKKDSCSLSYIILKSDWILNMDYMYIWDIETTSVILSKAKYYQRMGCDAKIMPNRSRSYDYILLVSI